MDNSRALDEELSRLPSYRTGSPACAMSRAARAKDAAPSICRGTIEATARAREMLAERLTHRAGIAYDGAISLAITRHAAAPPELVVETVRHAALRGGRPALDRQTRRRSSTSPSIAHARTAYSAMLRIHEHSRWALLAVGSTSIGLVTRHESQRGANAKAVVSSERLAAQSG